MVDPGAGVDPSHARRRAAARMLTPPAN